MKQRFNKQKFYDGLLYICLQSIGDKTFSESKALWCIFYADQMSYILYGKSITGATYVKDSKRGFPISKEYKP